MEEKVDVLKMYRKESQKRTRKGSPFLDIYRGASQQNFNKAFVGVSDLVDATGRVSQLIEKRDT